MYWFVLVLLDQFAHKQAHKVPFLYVTLRRGFRMSPYVAGSGRRGYRGYFEGVKQGNPVSCAYIDR